MRSWRRTHMFSMEKNEVSTDRNGLLAFEIPLEIIHSYGI